MPPAASSRDIALRVIAETKEYAAGLREIDGMTAREAAKAAATFARETTKGYQASARAAKTQARQAAEAFEDASKAGAKSAGLGRSQLVSLKDAAFDAFNAIVAGQNPLKAIAQQGPQAYEAITSVEGGFGKLAATLGVSTGALAAVGAGLALVAQAAVVGYVAWAGYTEESRRASETAAKVHVALEALQPIIEDTRDATIDLKEATGELSEMQADLERNSLKAWRTLQKQTEETRKQLKALHTEQGSITTQLVDMGESLMPAWTPYGYALRALTTNSSELGEEIDGLNGTLREGERLTRENVTVTNDAAVAEDKSADAKKRHERATAGAKKELEEYNRLLQESADLAERQAASFAGLGDQVDDKRTAALERQVKARRELALVSAGDDDGARAAVQEANAIAAVNDALTKEVALLQQLRDQQLAIAGTQAAEESARGDYLAAKVEAERAAQLEIDIIREQSAQAEMARLERFENAQLSAYSNLFGSIAEIARTAGEGMTEEQKEAAYAMFYVQQGAALAQAGINAALGISQAAASAPPPYNVIPIAAAIAQGAVNVGAVLAVPPPSFNDTPRAISLAQRQTMSFGSGDHVVAARDPKEVKRQADALNGLDPHADYRNDGPSVAIVGARAFGRRVADDVRLRTPLQRAIFGQNGGPTGQRGRR